MKKMYVALQADWANLAAMKKSTACRNDEAGEAAACGILSSAENRKNTTTKQS
jgi:hypothetical protein